MTTPQNPIQLLGVIFNAVDQPEGTPAELAHAEGLTFVAMDARAWPDFHGGTPGDEWVVSRQLHGDFPQLQGWPDTGWRFQDEAKAKAAYQKMRAHVVSHLPGVVPQEDKSGERRLNDPERALGEAFLLDGDEALYLSCDRATEARILEMLTDRLEAYSTRGKTPHRHASYSSQVAPHFIGVTPGADGNAEHVVVAFSPGDEQGLISAGLTQSAREGDLKPFQLEIPSGILVIAWGRIDGAAYFAGAAGQSPEQVLEGHLGDQVAVALPTALDELTDFPLAWAVRVRPGTYGTALRFQETEAGISAMALSHLEAKPLWADQLPRRAAPAPAAHAPPTAANIAQAQAAMAAMAAMANAGGGDADPVVFPGAKLAKLSDYVRLTKGIQKGDMMGALAAAGLDMMGYAQIASDWGMKIATEPGLAMKYSALMAKG